MPKILNNYGITLSEFGTADVLIPQPHLPLPNINDDQILLETHYAGLNPIDYKTRQGLGWGAEKFKNQLPAILGFDASGIVAKAGKNSGFQVGERVAALTFDGGAYSHYFAINANLVARIPDTVSLQQAAALPTAGVTALQILRQANLKTGQKILLSAPAGGVGHVLLQLLKQQQFDVIAICSPSKQAYIAQFGIQHFLDYTALNTYPELNASLFIDLVGGETGINALSAVNIGGRVICVPTLYAAKLQQAGISRQLQVEKILAQPNAADLSTLLAYIAQQQLHLEITAIYPWSEIQAAHRQLEQGHTQGKMILDMRLYP